MRCWLPVLAGLLAACPGSAAVKIHLVDGRPVAGGIYVNGHGPYSFLIDTGTTSNHLDPKLAASLGLKPTFRSELITSAGQSYVPGADGIEVDLGPVHAGQQRFLFTGAEALRRLAPELMGVLGQAFLSHFDYRLDLRHKSIEFGTHEATAHEVRTPFHVEGARPVLPTSLGALVLDSGSTRVTLFGVTANSPMQNMLTMNGAVFAGSVSRWLRIGGRIFWQGTALAIPGEKEGGAAGLLPVNLFQSVYVSNSESYISLE